MLGMESRNQMKAIRDVSCTSSPRRDSELRSADPNPLDFRCAMEKIRGKLVLLFCLKSCLLFLSGFRQASCGVRKPDLLL